MDFKNVDIVKELNPRRIIWPVMLGLAVVLFLFLRNDELRYEDILRNIQNANLLWIGLAVLVLFVRDIGYMYRIRHLTDEHLSWKSSFFVIILWEFASAVTPSAVGGTAIAAFIINREKISFGRSLAFVMITAVLDNMFFVMASIFVLVVMPLIGLDIFPPKTAQIFGIQDFPLQTIFTISVTLIALYTFVMIFALFSRPRLFKWLLFKITQLPLLRRLRHWALETGNEVIIASEMLRGKSRQYWTKAILSTVFVWSARYFMLNCLIAAFAGINVLDHLLIFSRHIIMWVVMLISPTPGSTGTAEVTFEFFFTEFLGSFSVAVALFWRLFTYYAYLALGAIALPRWLRKVFGAVRHAGQ